ncbi:MAG TPA: archaeosortase/exosortase family protein [Caldisericia bacterium]|nr:archaeosortase/exosortase family protein [Caldisericia bacterium]HQJ40860.1 archaeosortase/exosortase family protein [Exilispira sp.]HXK69853.1 archaeosortase/exosortase family protein [Caldisericia bacterium]
MDKEKVHTAKNRLIKFSIYFFLILIALQIITHLSFISEPITYFTTFITGSILKIFFPDITVKGFHIMSKSGLDMEIIYECTGIYGIIVYSSAILSTWFPAYEKLKGITIGVPIIYIANILRLVLLFVVSLIYPPAFEFLHTYFWQLFLIIVVVLLFYFWFRSNLVKSKVIRDE